MRLKVDQAADALYLALTEGSASHSEKSRPASWWTMTSRATSSVSKCSLSPSARRRPSYASCCSRRSRPPAETRARVVMECVPRTPILGGEPWPGSSDQLDRKPSSRV